MTLKADDKMLAKLESLMSELAQPYPPLDKMLGWHLQSGGKRLRARLALSAGSALGVDNDDALIWGAACELMHNATLVHDDVQDGDRFRRGAASVWSKFGVAQAINLGDLSFMLAFNALAKMSCEESLRWHLSAALAGSCAKVIHGQSYDVDLCSQETLSWEHYLRIIDGKTGAFFELPIEGILILGDVDSNQRGNILRGFQVVGRVFQIVDDIIDLFADKGRDMAGNDIKEGKLSALVVEYCNLRPDNSQWLLDILKKKREDTSADDIAAVKAEFEETRVVEALSLRITDYEALALEQIGHLCAPLLADTEKVFADLRSKLPA
tara:strand:+ start:370 stop:1341 length:972 start_codon:yes stop_codon:yes gene_type:complete